MGTETRTVNDEILTVAEAAKFAKVSEEKIRFWFTKGLRYIPTTRTVGKRGPRQAIVRRAELERFLKELEVGIGPAPEPTVAAKPARPRPAPSSADDGEWVAGGRRK